jgi:beta-lactamase regulating signal transducer with metallopeptidase domain
VDAILELGLLNGVLVAALALVVAGVTWLCRKPALAHALWLLVLIKLLTPPLVPVEVPRPALVSAATEELPDVLRYAEVPVSAPAVQAQTASQPEAVIQEDVIAAPAAAVVATESLPTPGGGGQSQEPAPANRGLTCSRRQPAPTATAGWPSWQTGVLMLWLAGSCLWWGVAARRLCRFRRLLWAAGLACPEVRARAEALARRLGISHCPPVRLLPATLPPLLWSLLGPASVFLPERLWAKLSADQQDTLLAHELAHYKRRDHWVRWLELLALGLYWWHPAAWVARRALHEAEELLCDARVLRALPAAADAYAQALIQTVAFLSGPRLALPGAASGMGHVRPLKARITMMMRGTNADRLPRAGAWALAGLGVMLLVLRPVWADAQTATTSQQQPPAVEQSTPPAVPGTALAQQAPQQPPTVLEVQDQPGAPGRVGQAASGSAALPGRAAKNAAEQVEQVELLKAQLAAKEAELHEARAMSKLTQQRLKRMSQLNRNGTLGQDELEQAQADAEVQQARVQGKEAQLREAQLRLAQATRRSTARREAGQEVSGSISVAPVAPRAGRPGARMAGPGMAPPETTPVPAQPGTPAVAGAPSPSRAANAAVQDRLERLESRLEKLLKEVQSLRNEISENRRRAPGGGRPPATSSLRRQTNPFGGPGEIPPPADLPGRP